MSFSSEKLNIMIRKKLMRIPPSIKLKATDGRTGCRYVLTVRHVCEYQGNSLGSAVLDPSATYASGRPAACWLIAAGVFGEGAQPAPMKSAFVRSNGAATNSRMLK